VADDNQLLTCMDPAAEDQFERVNSNRTDGTACERNYPTGGYLAGVQ
jgi:hypothetical protein